MMKSSNNQSDDKLLNSNLNNINNTSSVHEDDGIVSKYGSNALKDKLRKKMMMNTSSTDGAKKVETYEKYQKIEFVDDLLNEYIDEDVDSSNDKVDNTSLESNDKVVTEDKEEVKNDISKTISLKKDDLIKEFESTYNNNNSKTIIVQNGDNSVVSNSNRNTNLDELKEEENKQYSYEQDVKNGKIKPEEPVDENGKKVKKKFDFFGEKNLPVYLVIGIILLAVAGGLGYCSFKFEKTFRVYYSENSDLKYNVNFKKNDYFDSEYDLSDTIIISSLVDSIDANFTYAFTTLDPDVVLGASYYVEGKLIIYSTDNKNIFTKTYTLVDEKDATKVSNNRYTVAENINIDYTKYNNLAKSFLSNYGLTADAKLVISLVTSVKGEHSDYTNKLSKNNSIVMTIPLNETLLDINLNYQLSNNDNQVLQYDKATLANKVLFAVAILIGVVDVICEAGIIYIILSRRSPNSLYNSAVKKIMNEYGSFIGETYVTESVEDLLKTRSLRIVAIKTFEDFIDIRNNLHLPVLMQKENNGDTTTLYMFNDRVGYIFSMKVSDFEKNKKSVMKNIVD